VSGSALVTDLDELTMAVSDFEQHLKNKMSEDTEEA
jgi:hypothetical protein